MTTEVLIKGFFALIFSGMFAWMVFDRDSDSNMDSNRQRYFPYISVYRNADRGGFFRYTLDRERKNGLPGNGMEWEEPTKFEGNIYGEMERMYWQMEV